MQSVNENNSNINKPEFEYDVVFSSAGEQKDYVEKVAEYIKKNDIKVWHYGFEEVELWGRNLIDALSEIFTKSAKYCVIFISKEYTEKVWPNLERQFIQSRWLKDKGYTIIEVDEDEWLEYNPCNLVILEAGKVVMVEGAEKTVKAVRREGVDAIEVPYTAYGPTINCATMKIRRDPGPGIEEIKK